MELRFLGHIYSWSFNQTETLDSETTEVLNHSDYLQRLEMLWGDLAEWL